MKREAETKVRVSLGGLALALAAILVAVPGQVKAQSSTPAAAAANGAKAVPACSTEIPTGVRVIRMPEDQQHKVAISDFNVSTSKDPDTYNLAMDIKNGTDNWCVTSLGVTYVFGDARGQEWTANEYPAVLNFKDHVDSPQPVKKAKRAPPPPPAPNVGMPPGKEEKRLLINVYDYIQPRPEGYFDGFHLISAEIKYCMGYSLTESKVSK